MPVGLDLASKRKRTRKDYFFHRDYRLRWSDNDMFSHMNNPYYGVLIDSIINEYLINWGYKVNKGDQAAIIANTYCDYFGSVSYPDMVECGMRVVKLGKASVKYEVGIFRQGEEAVKAVGGSYHVFVDQAPDGTLGKVRPEGMPAKMREGLSKLVGDGVIEENATGGAKL